MFNFWLSVNLPYQNEINNVQRTRNAINNQNESYNILNEITLNFSGKSLPTTSFSRTPSFGFDDMTHLHEPVLFMLIIEGLFYNHVTCTHSLRIRIVLKNVQLFSLNYSSHYFQIFIIFCCWTWDHQTRNKFIAICKLNKTYELIDVINAALNVNSNRMFLYLN